VAASKNRSSALSPIKNKNLKFHTRIKINRSSHLGVGSGPIVISQVHNLMPLGKLTVVFSNLLRSASTLNRGGGLSENGVTPLEVLDKLGGIFHGIEAVVAAYSVGTQGLHQARDFVPVSLDS
jgi:hypothetical protein